MEPGLIVPHTRKVGGGYRKRTNDSGEKCVDEEAKRDENENSMRMTIV